MKQNAFITGADRGLGFALSERLLNQGWQVFAGQNLPEWPELEALRSRFPEALHLIPLDISSSDSVAAAAKLVEALTDSLDLLVNNAGVQSPTVLHSIREPQDYAEMQRLYNVNTLGALRMVEAFLPLMDHATMKRLCFVSSEAGSIGRTQRTAWYGYTMSKTALNMAVQTLFNHLRPEGYSFRLYHPGWIRSYMHGTKSTEGDLELEEAAIPALAYFLDAQTDEETLVLRDLHGQAWPW